MLGAHTVLSPSGLDTVDDGIRIDDSDVVIVGLAVSWEPRDAYYISLTSTAAKGLPLRLLRQSPCLRLKIHGVEDENRRRFWEFVSG